MVSFTFKTKSLIALVGLCAVGVTAGAIACSLPAADSMDNPEAVVDAGTPPASGFDDWNAVTAEDLLTPEVRDRILQTAAADLDLPVSSLRIAAAETATWDGCMGIYEPDQACTMIAMLGMRLVITDGEQSWVYHTRQDGQGMVQNPTATSYNGLIPDFIPEPPPGAEEPEPVLFRSLESGGLAGFQTETMLLEDGRLVRTENGTVVFEKQLSSEQVAAFQQVLADQRFPNLNQLRYITDAAFADYPTVQLSAMHLKTVYIDLAIADAPSALQTVVQAWDALIAEAE